jgi:hypothetical protein
MPKKSPPKEGRVNIPLGPQKQDLSRHAKAAATTETGLGRILILDGLDRLDSGRFEIIGPRIQEVSTQPA